MSGIRRRVVVVLDGEKHEIVTTARDITTAERSSGVTAETQPMLFTMHVVHSALKRLNVSGVPDDFETFLDTIDDFEDLESDATDANPTR